MICSDQQEAVITSRPCRIFHTLLALVQRRSRSFCWFDPDSSVCLMSENYTDTLTHGLSVFSQHKEEENRLKSLSPSNAASLPIVLWLSEFLAWKRMFCVDRRHVYILLHLKCVLSRNVPLFHAKWVMWTQMPLCILSLHLLWAHAKPYTSPSAPNLQSKQIILPHVELLMCCFSLIKQWGL